MKPVMQNETHVLTIVNKSIIKIQNSKLFICLEYQNIKIFFQNATLQIGRKKYLWSGKLKTLFRGHIISDLKGEDIVGTFYENKLQETNSKEFRIEKVIKRKGDKFYVK